MAYAAARFTDSLMKAKSGKEVCVYSLFNTFISLSEIAGSMESKRIVSNLFCPIIKLSLTISISEIKITVLTSEKMSILDFLVKKFNFRPYRIFRTFH